MSEIFISFLPCTDTKNLHKYSISTWIQFLKRKKKKRIDRARHWRDCIQAFQLFKDNKYVLCFFLTSPKKGK